MKLCGWLNGYEERYPRALRNMECGAECGAGWRAIVEPLLELCEASDVEVVQIKEKFGGLRFYVNAGDDAVHRAIAEAESKSFEVCEECGKPGKRGGGYWISTLCDEHAGKR